MALCAYPFSVGGVAGIGRVHAEHDTVGQVAETLHLSRSRVAHAVQPQALELVAKRFLDLAWNLEMPA